MLQNMQKMEKEQLAILEKKDHSQILEIKYLVIEIINSIDGMNFRPDAIKKRIGELEEY